MGIPRFASWLTKKFPLMARKEGPASVHGLYIDMNGIIHPCCHSEGDPKVNNRTEEEKIEQVCYAVSELVETAKPTHILYLAMDGVAPRAKMNQQRARRYMSAVSKYGVEGGGMGFAPREYSFSAEEREAAHREIKETAEAIDLGIYGDNTVAKKSIDIHRKLTSPKTKKYYTKKGGTDEIDCGETTGNTKNDDEDEKVSFDSNCISPGTVFMKKCSDRLKTFVAEKLATDERWKSLAVIVSDTNTPGEGEHKIIDFIRTQMTYGSAWSGMGYHVIHGNDADLILLCLGLHIPRVMILRENTRTGTHGPSLTSPTVASPSILSPDAGCGGGGGNNNEPQKSDSDSSTSETEVEATPPPEKKDDKKAGGKGKGGRKGRVFPPRARFEWYDIDTVGGCIVTELYETSKKASGVLKNVPDMQAYTEGLRKKIVVGADGVGKAVPVTKSGNKQRCDAAEKEKPWTAEDLEAAAQANQAAFVARASIPINATTGLVVAHPCTAACNHRVVDDFITLATLMGNDFMPRLPSCFCGDSAMDNIMEVYVRCVLPYGYLSNPISNDLDLKQLHRFFKGYAMLETSLFRQFCIKQNILTQAEAMSVAQESLGGTAAGDIRLPSAVDKKWRDKYYGSTTIGTSSENLKGACTKYIEGIRFVLRYYSTTSRTTSWSWYYPYHHSPFAADLANFLEPYLTEKKPEEALLPPKLEVVAPLPVPQLMAILPPTSSSLLPKSIGKLMRKPPPKLQNTFPCNWQVDYTAADGQEHLAAVLLPFANFAELIAASEELKSQFSEEEAVRNINLEGQSVYIRKPAESKKSSSNANVEHGSGEQGEAEASAEASAKAIKFIEDRVRGGVEYKNIVEGNSDSSNGGGVVLEYNYIDVSSKFLGKPKTYTASFKPPSDGPNVLSRDEKRAKNYKRRSDKTSRIESAGYRYIPRNFLIPTEKGWFLSLADFHLALGIMAGAVAFVASLGTSTSATCLLGIYDASMVGLTTAFVFGLGSLMLCVMGVGVTNPRKESGIKRNNIRDAYVDWLCSECLSLNFSRNEKCFTCGAPCDESTTSWALFSNKMPQNPPHLDPDHSAYLMDIAVQFPTEEEEEAARAEKEKKKADRKAKEAADAAVASAIAASVIATASATVSSTVSVNGEADADNNNNVQAPTTDESDPQKVSSQAEKDEDDSGNCDML